MTAYDETVPVLIVGGGYAGLASSLFLSHHGVRSVLVDRHPDVSIQGRARGINQRTMEIYRPLGLERRIREAGRPFDEEAGVVRCETLAGEWNWILEDDTRRALPDLTACEFGMADQRSVEPILIDAARGEGADIRFNVRCVSVRPDAGGVTVVTEDRGTGRRRTIRADYLVAADGCRGTIREELGIDRPGPGVTQHWVTFVAQADLSDIVEKRAMFWIVVNDEIGLGSFLTTAVPGQWAISLARDPATQPAAGFTPERCAGIARSVIGRDVRVDVLDIAHWEEAVGVADRFRAGRVLLAGDSAHVWPPAGAMGANAAVQDAHNLAWKLAGVVRGWAGEELLDSYEAERRPVAQSLADITVRRQRARFGGDPDGDDVDDVLCILGQRYRSSAVAGAAHDTVYGTEVEQRAAPGTRAPHLWLHADGVRITVHDLFHDAFVLLTGADGGAWAEAARQVAERTAVPLRAYQVGPASAAVELIDIDGGWQPRYNLGRDGAVLVRPDGYVAWRGGPPAGDAAARLTGALDQVLGTPR
ncbi:FAD-dependent oxidoreductase [Microtetraspora sp. NBRC 13810]|uniref:FAD-dependent monooxygenase n=1 Tax=Microtetraspora sp. NBRC 13810 TaxID=3030990 RepID=UPI0024A4C246|nr:FAD-dependent monooxygenase [Microtetraspora sp. NBRC 13810]GLW06796.1 FAD-dependent oxidoreductase [Microtetraspora sp. NBRC 13810]